MVGSITVCCGVWSAGVVGPKTAMELGQNIFCSCPSLARSRIVNKPSMLSFQAKSGFFSAVAESSAANKYTSLMPCSIIYARILALSRASSLIYGPLLRITGHSSRRSAAITAEFPNLARSAKTSSVPIWPQEPSTNIFDIMLI